MNERNKQTNKTKIVDTATAANYQYTTTTLNTLYLQYTHNKLRVLTWTAGRLVDLQHAVPWGGLQVGVGVPGRPLRME